MGRGGSLTVPFRRFYVRYDFRRFVSSRAEAMIGMRQGWKPVVTERLQELRRLPDGWDGYAGKPVSLVNAITALRILEVILSDDAPPPQIVPGPGGDLQIEWHLPSCFRAIEVAIESEEDYKAALARAYDLTDAPEGSELVEHIEAYKKSWWSLPSAFRPMQTGTK